MARDHRKKPFVKKRPSEVATGVGIAPIVFGFLTQIDVSDPLAAAVAVAAATVPAVISGIVDAYRKGKP